MFEGFETQSIDTPRGAVHARVGGSGPPLLLLHGYPETHLMWQAAVPALAQSFTVVAADLPGYGASFRPAPSEDHSAHSKRAMAADLVETMSALGHESFSVAGHDRGGRVAYRMALDHPARVTRLAVLDIVPTAEMWARADRLFALAYWHCGFLAQSAPLPEGLIDAAPDHFLDECAVRMGLGLDTLPAEVVAAYRAQMRDPGAVEAMCEDYRANAFFDRDLDETDRGRRIACPTLVLWGTRGALEVFYDDVLAIWDGWCEDAHGHAVEASHFLVEDRPDEVAAELAAFFAS